MNRVDISPRLLEWSIARSGKSEDSFNSQFPQLGSWRLGESKPTLKQLERFSKAACVPLGFLFLAEPPDEKLPIQDFRTIESSGVRRPSADLLETIYTCQRRQAWYREHAQRLGELEIRFIGSATLSDDPEATSRKIAAELEFHVQDRLLCTTWEDAFKLFVKTSENAGVMVMISGIVGNNTHRPLDRDEFQGFALADSLAPLVFVNGADFKAAQMFTLAHELAHLWLGQSALSDAMPNSSPVNEIERWCNRVAAELLVPIPALRSNLTSGDPISQIDFVARIFKVSKLVILRRMLDGGIVSQSRFNEAYRRECSYLTDVDKPTGGNYYPTQKARLGLRFAKAVIESASEGHTLFRDAFQLLGISKEHTFQELSRSLD